MGLRAHVNVALQDRHEVLRRALENMEIALSGLESDGGLVKEDPRGTSEVDSAPRVRVHAMPPLRQLWNRYKAEVFSHLDREGQLLPALARGLMDHHVDADTASRHVSALLAEHELLFSRTVQVRKAFLGIPPLRVAFTRVVEEFEDHAREQDTGVFPSLIELADHEGEFVGTPTVSRYRVADPTRDLRANLSQPPAPQRRPKRPWSAWFRKAFSIQGPAVRY